MGMGLRGKMHPFVRRSSLGRESLLMVPGAVVPLVPSTNRILPLLRLLLLTRCVVGGGPWTHSGEGEGGRALFFDFIFMKLFGLGCFWLR